MPRRDVGAGAALGGIVDTRGAPSSAGSADATLQLELLSEECDWASVGVDEAAIECLCDALERFPSVRAALPAEACVLMTSDAAVRALNDAWRHQDKPTNVLSFATAPGPGAGALGRRALGDIVLAAETIRREACEMGITPRDHTLHLVTHGILHLIGLDHVEDGDAMIMERAETEILARLGIADPHAPLDQEDAGPGA